MAPLKPIPLIMHASGTTQANSVRKALSYYHKKQYITRIRRGLYAVNHPHMGIDPYLVAAHASPNAILAYHTALELHNLAYTTFAA